METKETTPAAAAAYAKLTESMAEHGAAPANMFGMPVLKFEKKAFCGVYADGVNFRLMAGTPEHAEALALAGAELFDPSGKGRAMKDWVQVPAAHAKKYAGYATIALSRLGS